MTIQLLFLQLSLLLIFVFSPSTSQFQSDDKRSVIPGSAETAEGCLVTASEACFVRREHPGAKHRFEVIETQVKIHNLSGRALRSVKFSMESETAAGGGLIEMHREDSFAINESRHVVYKNLSHKLSRADDFQNFTVKIQGIEFDDRSHWVAPRNFITHALHSSVDQRAPVTVVNCLNLETSYQAKLRFHSDKVLAYQLGVVKDMVGGFEVALGNWVNLSESPTNGTELPITAGDENPSLTQDKIFPLEPHLVLRKSGTLKSFSGGVALFVAEVKLKDGKSWSQSLKREDLLYGN